MLSVTLPIRTSRKPNRGTHATINDVGFGSWRTFLERSNGSAPFRINFLKSETVYDVRCSTIFRMPLISCVERILRSSSRFFINVGNPEAGNLGQNANERANLALEPSALA